MIAAKKHGFFKNYGSILLLLGGILAGSVFGLLFKNEVKFVKPLGDIFLNLLFTAVIPLVFFAIASAIAHIDRSQRLGRLFMLMIAVFIATVLVAAILTILAVKLFPIHQSLVNDPAFTADLREQDIGQQITGLISTGEFYELLSRGHMLALILFSVLTGFAALRSGEAGSAFRAFLKSGDEVMQQLLMLVMKVAPLGLGAYFAYQAAVFGPQLFGTYARSLALYYGFGTFYFVVLFSVYAFIGGGAAGISRYWRNNLLPGLTAIGTCSSIAVIPANLEAARKMGIPEHIGNMVVPLGATLHKDGSSISSIVKIAVVFAMFGKSFSGADTLLLALGITVIVSIVEGGIPNGGYIGELLVISVYGFPPAALPAVMIVGTLVDPLATLLNATGDTVAGMMIARIGAGKTVKTAELHLKNGI
ncbi:dicarboxylate/amino acid:cation symporter [Compostibacter hankyongensis]|uniref:Dicarboxylate/amino acid:cation symporter n=1 Tax=Compostibacter hankyongensis TaxID=1007089 RepID=A0ABP8FJG6_9BACT